MTKKLDALRAARDAWLSPERTEGAVVACDNLLKAIEELVDEDTAEVPEVRHVGCICPPGANIECRSGICPRKSFDCLGRPSTIPGTVKP